MNINILTSLDHRIIGFIDCGIIILLSVITIIIRYYKGKNK
jgi:hypothetical protein